MSMLISALVAINTTLACCLAQKKYDEDRRAIEAAKKNKTANNKEETQHKKNCSKCSRCLRCSKRKKCFKCTKHKKLKRNAMIFDEAGMLMTNEEKEAFYRLQEIAQKQSRFGGNPPIKKKTQYYK